MKSIITIALIAISFSCFSQAYESMYRFNMNSKMESEERISYITINDSFIVVANYDESNEPLAVKVDTKLDSVTYYASEYKTNYIIKKGKNFLNIIRIVDNQYVYQSRFKIELSN